MKDIFMETKEKKINSGDVAFYLFMGAIILGFVGLLGYLVISLL